MPEVTKYAPGEFCWMEIGTTDVEAASAFYGPLLGWTFVEGAPDSEFTYWMIQKDGKDLGGLYELMKEMRDQGVPPHWMSYVNVADVDATTARIRELGGKVMMGPHDVMEHGRMTVAADPTGAAFAIWQAKNHIGARLTGETGTPCWHEVMTRDTDKAGAFYTNVFPWTGESMPMGGPVPYTMFKAGAATVGGMMYMDENFKGVPPHWMVYVSVADCDGTAAKAQELGGKVIHPPTDIPNIGRFCILMDPQGAAFSVIKLA